MRAALGSVRKAYVTYLRSAVVAGVVGLSAMVTAMGDVPEFTNDAVALSPGACESEPTGHMRFNPCANLDTSRMEVRK